MREIHADEAVRVGVRTTQEIEADREAFLTPEGLADREAAELRARYEAWKLAAQAMNEDPALLVHFTFEEDASANRTLVNHGSRARPETHGSIIGCEWVEGRWPGKGALEFKRPGDRVRMTVPRLTPALTYLLWVRVDALPHFRSALVLPQKFREHEVHWQISNQGQLWFSIRRGDPMDESQWDRVLTRPIITPRQFSQWMQFVAVYDGPNQKMAVYVNGQEVDSKIIRQPVNLALDVLELGNWNPQPEAPEVQRWFRGKGPDFTERNFHGRMDEFAMFARALSPQEIRANYELGKQRNSLVIAEAP